MIPLLIILYAFSRSFIFCYLIICYITSLALYLKVGKYYFPRMKPTTNKVANANDHHQYFHEEYPAFNREDLPSVSFFWIFYGVTNFFWFKLLFAFLGLFLMYIRFKILFNKRNPDTTYTKEDRATIDKVLKFCVGVMYKSIGGWPKEENYEENFAKVETVYRKYLGDAYNPRTAKDKFTTVIANHVSWFDILYTAATNRGSFIAKDSIKKIPMIGYLAKMMRTLLIDRTSKDSRLDVLHKIEERQNLLTKSKESTFPLCLYPEGTTTNGASIITFKKGAFFNLTSVKPFVFLMSKKYGTFSLATAGMNMIVHVLMSATFFNNDSTVIQLPVIEPNEFMFEHYSNLGKDKPEIFAEVTRRIMSEVSGLPCSSFSFEDKLRYISRIKNKSIKNT